jgi:hypothetical protein
MLVLKLLLYRGARHHVSMPNTHCHIRIPWFQNGMSRYS